MIAETRSYVFRWRSRCCQSCVCLSSLLTCRNPIGLAPSAAFGIFSRWYSGLEPKTGAGSGKREFQLWVGTGVCTFLGMECEIGKGNRKIRIRDFSISRPCSSRAQKPQAGGNEPFVRIAVSGFKWWIGTALNPVRSCQTYPLFAYSTLVSDRMRSLSPTVIFCFEETSEWQAFTDSSCGFGGRIAW